MNITERIIKSPFYEIVSILRDFANVDYTTRTVANKKKVPLLPHEQCLFDVRDYLWGISSSYSNMYLSIVHIRRRHNAQYFMTEGFTDYDVCRYHYYVYCHGITTIHDLFFKLIVELCDIRMSNRMVKWEDLREQLAIKGEDAIINIVEKFYKVIKLHEKKRNTASHEGLLTYNTLDHFYASHFLTNLHKRYSIEKSCPEYTEGTNENKRLLRKTKQKFINELESIFEPAIQLTLSLFDLLLPKLIDKVGASFINAYKQPIRDLHNENLNKYVLDVL